MSGNPDPANSMPIGIIGFGAFGQLMARHIRPHRPIVAFDIRPDVPETNALGVTLVPFETVAHAR